MQHQDLALFSGIRRVAKVLSVSLATTVAAQAGAADISGSWKFENTFNGSVSVVNCTLQQKGEVLSGSCKPDLPGMEPSNLKGTIKGQEARWGYDLVFNGQPARVDYEVKLSADGSLSGTLLRNGSGSPIKGVRKP